MLLIENSFDCLFKNIMEVNLIEPIFLEKPFKLNSIGKLREQLRK